MILDIFSSFDVTEFNLLVPSKRLFISMPILLIILITSNLWTSRSMINIQLAPNNLIFSQLSRTSRLHVKRYTAVITSLFIILLAVNLTGLLPYIFRVASHLLFTLSIRLPLWLTLILSSITYQPKAFIAHFLPDGAPNWLNPFLVLIESSRIAVRPLTLAFRLAANIRAGHIVLSLVGNYCAPSLINMSRSSIFLLLLRTGYILFEVAICLIQAYIFCLLLSIYSDDHTKMHSY